MTQLTNLRTGSMERCRHHGRQHLTFIGTSFPGFAWRNVTDSFTDSLVLSLPVLHRFLPAIPHDSLLVLSLPVLLCPEADSPQWNGLLQRGFPGEVPLSTLRYEVIRVWEKEKRIYIFIAPKNVPVPWYVGF